VRSLRVPVEGLSEGELLLDPETSHYVLIVHRLVIGVPMTLFDPRTGFEAAATLVRAKSKAAYCRVEAPEPSSAVPGQCVTLIQALAKGDKVDRVISDATALGVTSVVVVVTERCQVRSEMWVKPAADDRRRSRWERIAIDAARQSGRGNIPRIVGPLNLRQVLAGLPADPLRVMLSPRATERLRDTLTRLEPQPITVLVGPEGGLTLSEEDALAASGFVGARFGRFTLRTETCATAVLGALADWSAR
jgi:16S rRNA (uracil1498-N3)-methyltransferase